MQNVRKAILKSIAECEKAIARNNEAIDAAYVADITNAELELKLACLEAERANTWRVIDKLHDALAQIPA